MSLRCHGGPGANPCNSRLRPAAGAGDYRQIMLESVYLVVLIAAFLAIGAMSLFILFKLFAGQE
jgi:hypothetical protein